MNCLTDIGGNKGIGKKFVKDLNLGKTHLAGSFSLTAMYNYMLWSLRLEATFGTVSAEDKVLKKVKSFYCRPIRKKLKFQIQNHRFYAWSSEIHPLYILNSYSQDDEKEPPLFSPYLLAGVGFFSFKPQAKLKATNGLICSL